MAPEQARNAKYVDRRTDIYALVSTLYYFVTGEILFAGESTLELIIAKEEGRFTPARQRNRQVPEHLDLIIDIIDKTLAKNPSQRYKDCAELIDDLQSLGLDSPALSFIEGAVPATFSGSTAAGRSRTTKSLPKRAAVPVSSAEDAARTQVTQEQTTDESLRYVQHKNPQGNTVVSRLTTGQIHRGILGGAIDLKARGKRLAKDKTFPLAQFPEFTACIEKGLVKAKARSHSMANKFAELDLQDRRRRRWRWFRNLNENLKGLIGFIVYLAVLGAIGYTA